MPPNLSPLAERFLLLMELLAGGSQRSFASMVGCSQAAISKIARGQHQPGKQLMQRVLALPNVNGDWLTTGSGEPLLAPPPDHRQQVPVAVTLLPGPLADHRDLLTGRTVRSGLCRNGVYAVEAKECAPAAHDPDERIRHDDLLLVDAEPARWQLTPGVLHNRLCAIKSRPESGSTVELRRIWRQGVALAAYTDQGLSDNREAEAKVHEILRKYHKELRSIDLEPGSVTSARDDQLVRVSEDDVVGVAIQLIRDY